MTNLKKIFGVIIVLLILIITGISVFLFIQKDFIKNQSIKALNNQLSTQVDVQGAIDLTFLSTFPNITLSFNQVYITDKLRTNDSLASLDNVRLQLNTWALLNKNVSIDGIYARDGFIHLFTDKMGKSNFDILKPKENESASNLLQLKKIVLNNVELIYDDHVNNLYAEVLSIETEMAGSFYEMDFDISIETDLYNHSMFIDETALFPSKNIAGKLKMKYTGEDGCIVFDQNTLNIQNNSFLISGSVCSKVKSINLMASAEGNNLKEAIALVPEDWLATNSINGNGAFKIDASLQGELSKPTIKVDFNITNGSLILEDEALELSSLHLDGVFLKVANGAQSIHMKHFSAELDGSSISGEFRIPDLKQMNVSAELNGTLTAHLLNKFLPEPFNLTDGELLIENLALGLHQNVQDSLWQLSSIEGRLYLDSLHGNILSLAMPFSCSGEFLGKENFLWANGLTLRLGENDIQFNGELRNLVALLLQRDENQFRELNIHGKLVSQYFNLNDFITSADEKKSGDIKDIQFPPVFGQLEINIVKLIYQDLQVKNLQVAARANDKAYTFNVEHGECLGGSFNGQILTNVNQSNFELNLNCDIVQVDIQALFEAFDNFGQTDMGSENIRGTLNSQLAFSASWKNFSEFDAENFIMQSHVELKDGELIQFGPLLSLAGKLEVEQLEHLYFTDLEADISIKDEWIYIPMTTIQSNLLSLDAGGRHSFNNDIDYKLILNLKNLLAAKFKKNKTTEEDYVNDVKGGINLYISMTGTSENPIIKYDKKGVKDKMKADFKAEKQEFKNLFKKDVKSEFEQNELKFEELKEEDKYIDWED